MIVAGDRVGLQPTGATVTIGGDRDRKMAAPLVTADDKIRAYPHMRPVR